MATTAIAYPLPEELIEQEILTRLPVKVLVRFRSVCKLWNSLFSHSIFIQNHFNRNGFISPQEEDDDFILLYNRPRSISILSRCNLHQTHIDKLPHTFSSKYDEEILLVGSINGLVCIADIIHQRFILWNPAIHWFNKIPVPPCSARLQYGLDLMPYLFGFGWDSSTNDYKLIVKPLYSINTFSVYSCKSNTWNDQQVVSDLSLYNEPCPSVIVRGIPYWKSAITNRVLKFDVRVNAFMLLEDTYVGEDESLLNLNDCLALIWYGVGSGAYVFGFDEKDCIWRKIYTIETTIYNCISMSFKYGGGIVFNGIDNLYDPKSDTIKSLHDFHRVETDWIHGVAYTPTMLALDGMKSWEEAFRSSHKLDDDLPDYDMEGAYDGLFDWEYLDLEKKE